MANAYIEIYDNQVQQTNLKHWNFKIAYCNAYQAPHLFLSVWMKERISHIRSCYYVGLCCEINRTDIWKGCIHNFLVFSSWWLRDVEPNLIKLQLSIDNTHTHIECMNASHHHVCIGVRGWLSNLISTSSCVSSNLCSQS